MATTQKTVVLAVAAGLVLALTGCTGSGDDASTPSPSPSASGSTSSSAPSASATSEPAPEPTSAAPVPTPDARAWTDETAYAACVETADAQLEPGYTWAERSTQTLVPADGGVSMDVTGIFTGGDVGVANVTFRCLLAGDQSSPQVTGALVG